MTTLLNKGAAKYVALETFKKNGQAVNTPVWIVRDGNRLLAITNRDSWKVKRMRNNSRVRLAESDARGTPEGEFAEGHARIIDEQDSVQALNQLIIKKYGLFARLFTLMSRLQGERAKRVIVEITEPPIMTE